MSFPMLRRPRALFTLAACAALLATPACDDDDPTGPSGSIIASLQSDANVMAVLHESNVGEIQAGALAVQQATDNEVRNFAAEMVGDHTTLDQQAASLAAQLGISLILPDSTLPRLQLQEMAQLGAAAAIPASGADISQFDRTYIAQQIVAHRRTLDIVEASIARADNAQLRTMLELQVRPAIAAHLDKAADIRERIGR
jgi:putative membrane protein